MSPMHLCAHARLISAAAALTAAAAPAHVTWSRANAVSSDTLGLWHLSDANTTVGATLAADAPLGAGRGLKLAATAGPGAATDPSTTVSAPAGVFGPAALRLRGMQVADTSDTLRGVPDGTTGPVTIECWFAWPAGPGASTSSTLDVSFHSGMRLRVARDIANPANDRFGLSFTLGDYVSVPGFIDWPTVGSEEASLDEWRHLAVCVTPTGSFYDVPTGHEMYSTGTVARVYLNGHVVGTPDVSLKQLHESTRIRVATVTGDTNGVLIDEVAVWRRDWSADGAVAAPFGDGRPAPPAGVRDWMLHE